jgi:hypothetical protein
VERQLKGKWRVINIGYLKIQNTYREPDLFKCYALEKIHGTSAHISWKDSQLRFFAGGTKQNVFESLFDKEKLAEKFTELFGAADVIVHGESFGAGEQKMSHTYGTKPRFMAFDVRIDGYWQEVPLAEQYVKGLGLEFVPYELGPFTEEFINEQRDRPSRVAVFPDKISEGVVIRPFKECQFKNGERWIFKHKRPEFRETKTVREISQADQQILNDAQAIATEYVTTMRLQHVLQKTPFESEKDTGKVIKAMQEDIKIEAEGEIVWSNEVAKAIGKATAQILHSSLINTIMGENS